MTDRLPPADPALDALPLWDAEECPPMSAEKAAGVCRRVAILCGLLPACELTEAEVEWGFRTAACLAGHLTAAG